MKLEDLQYANVLARPASNKKNILDGTYEGTICSVEFSERDCQYSSTGKRIVLNIKVEVFDEEDEAVDLYISPNYSWSSRGHMVKILEKLEVFPAPGEAIKLDDLIDMSVKVLVENVEKDNVTYSNIVSIERIIQSPRKKPVMKKSIKTTSKFKLNESSNELDDLDELFD